MKTVEIVADIYCTQKHDSNPFYRLYINDEMIIERTFIWNNVSHYIEEHALVGVDPGEYRMHVESVYPNKASFEVRNVRIGKQTVGNTFSIN
jgi:hypothetical protein